MSDLHDLNLLINSNIALIVVETHEETRLLELVKQAGKQRFKAVFGWSITQNFRRLDLSLADDLEFKAVPADDVEAALAAIHNFAAPSLFVLCDLHPYLEDRPKVIRYLKDLALQTLDKRHTLVLLSHQLTLPAELKPFAAHLQIRLPNDPQLLQWIKEAANRWSDAHQGQKVKTTQPLLDRLVTQLRGLPAEPAQRLIQQIIEHDGAITEADLTTVQQQKFKLLNDGGVLQFAYDTGSFAEVAGLTRLKNWLQHRQKRWQQAPDAINTLDYPKGILLLGVQGAGKSLAAKAIAGLWQVPLLKLDIGSLYNKYIGETERNLRDSIELAESLAPCVLWLDELEKGLQEDSDQQGLSQRLLGTLLTWLAEKKSAVFIVATCNDVRQLPPELIRKGRFDEIFFVDLPSAETRAHIFQIHLQKRQQNLTQFDLTALATATTQFSGAEIEQIVVAGLYSAEAQQTQLTQAHLLTEISNTQPLAVVRAESIAQLRQWAENRTVSAD
jgi:SpoVK/Ycf46/Vps4 family AAA+-type ATPase